MLVSNLAIQIKPPASSILAGAPISKETLPHFGGVFLWPLKTWYEANYLLTNRPQSYIIYSY